MTAMHTPITFDDLELLLLRARDHIRNHLRIQTQCDIPQYHEILFENLDTNLLTLARSKTPEEPVAYMYELATTKSLTSDEYGGWKQHLSIDKPRIVDDSIRNLTPLYKKA